MHADNRRYFLPELIHRLGEGLLGVKTPIQPTTQAFLSAFIRVYPRLSG
jgi:hypothetical protein